MKFKQPFYLVLILLVLLSISAVSGADDSTSDVISTNTNQELILDETINEDISTGTNDDEPILVETNNEAVSTSINDDELILDEEGEPAVEGDSENPTLKAGTGTFTDLNNAINGNEYDIINLTDNYKYSDGDERFKDGISISRTVTINGGGVTIDGSKAARIFRINAANVIINNITFINAKANYGGAIQWTGANGTINNTNLTQNNATNGGAIYWDGENGNINNTNLTQNQATIGGGAIYWRGENGNINNTNLTHNNANYGGAIYWAGTNGNINNTNLTQNQATKSGGAIYWAGTNGNINNTNLTQNQATKSGGAIYWGGENGNINNTNLTQNQATEDGGAIWWTGPNGTINNTNLTQNNATNGGAIDWNGTNGNINNTNLTQNQATKSGGAIWWNGANGNINNTNLTQNQATEDGGAIWWSGENGNINNTNLTQNNATNGGGAIFWGGANGNINNTNLTQNNATNGGAIHWAGTNGTINNTNLTQNQATHDGGAIRWDSENGNINNTNLTQNQAKYGGAIRWYSDNGNITQSKFTQNQATYGGAIHCIAENTKINNNIFLSNTNTIYKQGDVNLDCNWWGNNASNYTDKPNEYCNNWLFLNATADPNPMETLSPSEIIFKLYLYNETAEEKITEYDNTLLPAINLTLSSTKGTMDKENSGLDENITYTPNALGLGSVTAMIEDVEQTIELEITQADPKLSYEDQETTYNKSTTINIQYKPEATGKVNVKLEGKQFNYTLTDLDLNTIISLGDINSDTYTVTVEYLGDENFIKANATGTLTVKKIQTEIIPTADTINLIAEETSNIGYSLNPEDAVGDIAFTSSNAKVVTVDSTGAIKAIGGGTATITLALSSTNYEAPNATVTVTVSKKDTKITTAAVTTTYKVNKNLVITLKDNKGNPISGVQVTVNMGSNKKYTTDKNGQVKVAIASLVPKTYTAKISFAGNNIYKDSSATAKVVVKKASPKITAKAKTFKYETKTKKYTITLKDNKGKVLKNKKVTLKVKGKTYTAKTNGKGKATFKLSKLTKKGKYTAVIKYAGDKYYKKATKKVKITVKAPAWKTVAKGSKDKKTVKKIQKALKNNGYYLTYKGHYLKIDGIYKGCTERSVKQFQKAKKLTATGKVDYKTAKKLKITS